MDVYTARNATDEEMMQFHTKEYIKYLGKKNKLKKNNSY